MLSKRSLPKNGALICVLSIVAATLSFGAVAKAGGFPLALAELGDVQTGSEVQTASGVIKTLLRLALEEEYPPETVDALAEVVGRLIGEGIPPGTILQVSRSLLESLAPTDLFTALEELGAQISAGEPPGQAANKILERGNAKNDAETSPGNGNGENGGLSHGKAGASKADAAGDAPEEPDPEEDEGKGPQHGKAKGKGKNG